MILNLLVPGIHEVLSGGATGRFPRLDKWIARAIPELGEAECYEHALLQALGYPVRDNAGLPAAQCTWLADFDESAPINCCRADPVHLQADKDHARLVPVENLSLEPAEAEELVAALNSHFAADALRFCVGQKGRWYLCGADLPAPDTVPTNQVAGRNVMPFMPGDAHGSRWRRLGTEAQMLLHAHPLNERRESQGLMPINSLWFWGGGKLVADTPAEGRESVCRVFSDAAFAVGAGKLLGMRVYPLEDVASGLPQLLLQSLEQRSKGCTSSSSSVIVLDTRALEGILLADTEAQQQALTRLEHGLFAAAEKLLLRGRIRQIRLDCCDGRCFTLSRRTLLQFWKKPGA